MTTFIRFTFDAPVPLSEVHDTLRLATVAAETLHGADRVLLEAHSDIDAAARRCVIGTDTRVGRTLALLFAGFVRREFGDDKVRVARVTARSTGPIGGDQ